MSGPERRRFELSAKKRALFEKLLGEQGVSSPARSFPRLEPRTGDAAPPLSFAQERLWFLDRLEPASPFYNLPQAVRFTGPLRPAVLEKALSEIVRRHEILRTTFAVPAGADGTPVQVIAPPGPVRLPVVDLRHLDEEDREERAHALANEEARTPFDLAKGPLMRARILRLGDEEFVLLFTLHHIVSDAWSAGILLRELTALYEAVLEGEPSPLAELSVQYADYAIGQRRWLRGEVLDEQVSYWKRKLAGAPPLLQLPSDRPRPARQSYRGAHRFVSLPEDVTGRLKDLSRDERASLFMTLLAAFQTLLHRLTGRDDILVGSLVANRTQVEIEPLIGFFSNTLVLRTDLSGDPTFRQLLSRVRETALEAFAHQDLPFERLVGELAPERDPSYHPLFQVMLTLQTAPGEVETLAGCAVSSIGTEVGTSRFDLALMLEAGPEGVNGSLEYSTDLFDDATMARWGAQWETLIRGIAANPDARLSDLPLLADAEARRLVEEWSGTDEPRPPDCSAHQLFEAQVERTPDALAVVFDDEEATYRELNEAANRLARHLRGLGVGRGSVVALHMERSAGLVAAVLAVLKAGGTCLALDPSWPGERLAFMLADSAAAVLVTEESLAGSLPGGERRVVRIDTERAEIARHEGTPLDPVTGPDDLAYVIYTSGSTGRPKGIAMPHRSLVNLVDWHRRTPSPCTRILQFAALSFDVSFQEILSCLASGATLLLPREATRLDAAELGRFIAERRVDRAHVPNAILNRLAGEFAGNPAPLASLREVMVGGEQLQITPALRRLFGSLKQCALFNHYGPAETHVVTSFPLPADPAGWPVLPPLGRPITGARMYVLDRRNRPAPVGVAGELHIGGVCVARGYLNRPDLTAERFLPDPFRATGGARMYRTGDRVRWLADGTLEFLGRADQQIKVRGVRVEPGEIEATLLRHPGVKEAVVLAVSDGSGEKSLVAYVVPGGGAAPSAADLRAHLRETLPDYMLPAWFVTSETFPKTPSGKVDRGALPPPERDREAIGRPFTPPRGPVEERLAAIWREVLELGSVGVDDGFFELGGHSLLATRVLSRVREAFGVEVPLRAFFSAPTIAAMAKAVEEASVAAEAGADGSDKRATRAPAQRIAARPRGGGSLESLLEAMERQPDGGPGDAQAARDGNEPGEGRQAS